MTPDFKKSPDGLIPVVIQDSSTNHVLMLGYMNKEAFEKTKAEKRVTFFSRSKNRLWTKGEESGNFLDVQDILLDCDGDTLLIKVKPVGPVCHTGADTCFKELNVSSDFLLKLEGIIQDRRNNPSEQSYTSSLFAKGINKIAQKVGEEAVETIIGAMANDDENFLYEGADLLYHLIVLLTHKGYRIEDLARELKKRHK